MDTNYRTVTDIDWDIDPAIAFEYTEDKTWEKAAELVGLPVDRYQNMTREERLDYVYDAIHHNKRTAAEIMDIPDSIVLPEEVVLAAKEDGYEVITEYLSDTYGSYINGGYKLSDELERDLADKGFSIDEEEIRDE